MKREAARQLALRIEEELAERPPDLLRALTEQPERRTVSEAGTTFRVVIDAQPEDFEGANGVRVMITVDTGGLSSLLPVSRHFFVETSA